MIDYVSRGTITKMFHVKHFFNDYSIVFSQRICYYETKRLIERMMVWVELLLLQIKRVE